MSEMRELGNKLSEEQDVVFAWNSHCLFECRECLAWWVCDHHWNQLWGDVEDNQSNVYIYMFPPTIVKQLFAIDIIRAILLYKSDI